MSNLVTSLWLYRIGLAYLIKSRPRDSELINKHFGFDPKVRFAKFQLAN